MCGAPGCATSEEALHLLALAVQRGLVRAPQVTSDFWLQPVFDKQRGAPIQVRPRIPMRLKLHAGFVCGWFAVLRIAH